MKARAHNPGNPPARQQNARGDKNCRYPIARGIFCGVFKRAKRCKRPCKQRRTNPDGDLSYVIYEGKRPAPTSGPLGTRRNPAENPSENPCTTCGFGVPPNPPGNASSRERWAWAMSQVGRPIVNPGGVCPVCGRVCPFAEAAQNPGPVDRCPGQVICSEDPLTCADTVSQCVSAGAQAQTQYHPWGPGGGQSLVTGTPVTTTRGVSPMVGAMRPATTGAPSTGAQMLMGRRQRRAAKHQLAMAGAVANPERVRNLSIGPTLRALQASHFVPAARPQQQQSINYPPIPNPTVSAHNPRGSGARRGGGFQPYWSIGGYGPWYWRTRSTPAVGYPPAVGWGAPPSVGVTPAWGPAPWGSFQYQGGFWPWNGSAPYPGRYRNASDVRLTAPTKLAGHGWHRFVRIKNPGALATTFLVAGAGLLGAAAGAGAVGYAACQPRTWHNHFIENGNRKLRLEVQEYPCAQDGLPYETKVTEYFGEDEPELSFGPQKTETYEGAIAWASEKSAFDWSTALAQSAARTDAGLKGQNGVVQNPGAVPHAGLVMPSMEISRAPKRRLRNAGVAQARARLQNPPPIYPGPGALSGPLPPQWFYYQSPSTAGAPPAPGISVAAPGPPPGVFGLGATCYNDRDCREDEYCHGGVCVRSPWDTGAGPTKPGSKLGNPLMNPAQMQSMSVPLAPGLALR